MIRRRRVVSTGTAGLTRVQLVALQLVVDEGRARVSNATDPARRTVSWRTARVLERRKFVHVLEVLVVATDKGKTLAARGLTFPPRRYPHGSHACAVIDQCRCQPCRQAATDYTTRTHKDAAYGRPRTVDAGPIREHVAALAAVGIGLKQVAKLSGVAGGALWKLVYGNPAQRGPSKRVRTATAQAILALDPADTSLLAGGACVDARPTLRLVARMLAGGFCKAEIARHVHGPDSKALQLGAKAVTARNARAVAELHRRWRAGLYTPEGRRSRWVRDPEPVVAPSCVVEGCAGEPFAGGRYCATHVPAGGVREALPASVARRRSRHAAREVAGCRFSGSPLGRGTRDQRFHQAMMMPESCSRPS